MVLSPDLLTALADETTRVLTPCIEQDWSVPAGDLEWSCWQTGVHLADDYFSYASQIIAQPDKGYLPVGVATEPGAEPFELLAVIDMCAELLRLATASASPSARGFHPMGISDAGGFLAMGLVEGLVHTYDLARGLGQRWSPPDELCVEPLARLFPEAPPRREAAPGQALLWCTGRIALEGRPRLTEWRWYGAVPGELDPTA